MGTATSPQVIGRYAIYSRIASGGMATVHFGRLLGGAGFSRTVAIKRLHPHLAEDQDVLSTLVDEARMAARIHHPNVVPTLDVVSTDGELLLVMEYVRGESLGRLIKTEGAAGRPIPLSIVSAIVIGCLHGLHAAHEATSDLGTPLGIVHRDVSPQNILVGVDGLARVIDFGVAKAAGRINTTRDGMIKGKLAYMAPEQLLGNALSRTADIYAMGVLLWELLTGKRLVTGENDTAIMAVAFGTKEAPSLHRQDVPPALDRLVLKALAPEPADRFETALDMAERLLAVVAPAFPTDVGAWCLEAARDSIAKRGALLAEIESESSGTLAPIPAKEALDYQPTRVERRLGNHDAERNPSLHDSPTVTSHSASVQPPPRAPRPGQRWWIAGAGVLGVSLISGLTLAFWPSPPAPEVMAPATDAVPVPTASPPAPVPVEQQPWVQGPSPQQPLSPPPPVPRSPVPVTPVAPVPPPAAVTAVTPSPRQPRAAPRSPPPPPPAAPAVAPSKPKCDPPYVIDSHGDRQYKPECL